MRNRFVLVLWAVLLGTPCPVLGDMITVWIPEIEIPYTQTSTSFTVSVQIDGSYNLDNYSLWLMLSPQDEASGVSFNTGPDAAQPASSDYIFTNPAGWATARSDTTNIAGDDGVFGAPQARGDGTWNLITVMLDAALTADHIGDKYDVTFFGTGDGLSRFQIDDGAGLVAVPSDEMRWNSGVITVVPEPSSIGLLIGFVASSLMFYRRRRKG